MDVPLAHEHIEIFQGLKGIRKSSTFCHNKAGVVGLLRYTIVPRQVKTYRLCISTHSSTVFQTPFTWITRQDQRNSGMNHNLLQQKIIMSLT